MSARSDERRQQDDQDLKEWLVEWRYWLAGALIMSAVWAVQGLRHDDFGFYWPVVPLGVWAAVLVSFLLWPKRD